MPPKTQTEVGETIVAFVTAGQAQQEQQTAKRRRANFIAFSTFLVFLAAITLVSWLLCRRFAPQDCVAGCTLFYSILGVLLAYCLALIVSHRLNPPAS